MPFDPHAKHILFITSSRIGDAVLSFGILDVLRRACPAATITIACGPLVVSLLEGFPGPKRIIPLKKRRYSLHWLDLWREVAPTCFDIVVDLRNSAVSRLVWARRRCIYGPHIDQNRHKAEQNADVLGLPDVPMPCLWPSAAQRQAARALIPPGGPVLGVGPTANWVGKTWPPERFTALIAWMIGPGGPMNGARVAIFAAPGEEEGARHVLRSVPPSLALDLIAKTDPGTAAAALALCAYFVGNDSGLMHGAAAAGVPTMGLFGPSYPRLYRPWGPHCAYVATPESFDELIAFEGYSAKTTPSLMGSLSLEAVQNAILEHQA